MPNLLVTLQNHENLTDYTGFLTLPDHIIDNEMALVMRCEERQTQEYQAYIDKVSNGDWADSLVQAVANMLHINIQVFNAITPD